MSPRPANLALAIAIAAPLCLAPGALAQEPEAVVSEPHADLGTIVRGEEALHTFVIENQGTAPLEILDVTASCGCTVTDYPSVIAPGGKEELTATVDSSSLVGEGATRIRVTTDDPDHERIYLQLDYEIEEILVAVPGSARFDIVRGEEEGTISQHVAATDEADFEILEVDTEIPGLRVATRKAGEEERREGLPGPQWIVDLTLDNFAPVGAVDGLVAVETSHPKQPTTWIPVTGFVRPIAAVTPPLIRFGEVSLDDPVVYRFQLKSFATGPLTVTGAETDLLGGSVVFDPVEPGRLYSLSLTLAPPMPKGPFEGTVTVTTDNPHLPKLTVPVTGTIR